MSVACLELLNELIERSLVIALGNSFLSLALRPRSEVLNNLYMRQSIGYVQSAPPRVVAQGA